MKVKKVESSNFLPNDTFFLHLLAELSNTKILYSMRRSDCISVKEDRGFGLGCLLSKCLFKLTAVGCHNSMHTKKDRSNEAHTDFTEVL